MRRTALVAALAMLAACEPADRTPEPVAEPGAAPAPAPAEPAVTDPQIADIVVAANNADIQAGELAQERATNAEVRQFAERMIADHNALNEQAQALAGRLGVTPESNPTSLQMRQEHEQASERLRNLTGAEFDRAYIEHEISFHQQVLDAIDSTLIPSADNPELESLLRDARPIIEGHLEHARQIQSRLAN